MPKGPTRSGHAGALTCRVQFARVQFEKSMHMAPRSWEVALSLLAGLGFGLALGRGDLIFVAVLALLVQWRLSEGCNVFREPIGSAVAIRALRE